ncbi:hypothetical protein MESS2_650067 [Mesorhizobium metallidurans STM 2683]|uniref:Uncharacterized protein n=1 Tax=Mesorhizobium metallidurans STM 2683 TaxID=1297569 RepID=M5EUF5_9HYPH|nr:hypothetical protein MESS2_650067 [Mesorhizobium metallidurans STM 2683]
MRIERDKIPPLPDGERVAGAKRRSGEGAANHAFVILGRSKERSDAAQTLGSMPLPLHFATVRNSDPKATSTVGTRVADILNRLGFSANVTAWILGSTHAASRVLRPRMTKAWLPLPSHRACRTGEAC